MSPVCSWDDVVYGIYNTAGRIAIAYEYGRGMYAKVLENVSSNTTTFEETSLRVLGT